MFAIYNKLSIFAAVKRPFYKPSPALKDLLYHYDSVKYKKSMTKDEALKKIEELKEFINNEDQKSEVQKAIDKIGATAFTNFGHEFLVKTEMIAGIQYVLVPLPHDNLSWSLAAFDWIKKFCAATRSFPVHYDYQNQFKREFIYIKFKN